MSNYTAGSKTALAADARKFQTQADKLRNGQSHLPAEYGTVEDQAARMERMAAILAKRAK